MDRLAGKFMGQAYFVRLDILQPVNAQIAEHFQVRSAPCILVFNASGRIVYRGVGLPNTGDLLLTFLRLKKTGDKRI